jgi:putative ATP-binding cassette transporter
MKTGGDMDAGKAASPSQAPTAAGPAPKGDGVVAQLMTLLRALAASPRRRRLGLLAFGVVAVICMNAAAQVWLNIWQRDFYQAIEQRQVAGFMTQLMVFAVIAGCLLVLVVSQTWLQAMVNVRLREWLTYDLLDQWLVRKRVYLLGFAGEIGVNPDQRIQQDAQHSTELATTLVIGLLQSSLLLISFTGVLWVLSGQVVFDFGNGPVTIPGYMVWCALAYSLGGSLLAWHVGRPLIPLNAERYAREADLRIALVRISEHADGIVLHDGEADERRLLNEPVDAVVTMMARLAGALARLTWITSGYGWLALVVPIVVASPGYFSGHMNFGTLMMVVGAFNQVQSSLRWFVDNLPQIADWRATLLRVVAFRDALVAVDTIGADTGRIEIVETTSDKIELDDLQLALPELCVTLDESRVEIGPRERIQILGEAASGKSTLFRALAGMWPWGGGTLRLPPRKEMTFMPQRPYLPLGTLRAAVCYPAEPGQFDDAAVVAALEKVDLAHLVPSLDRTERWDRQLPLDEQQRLAIARLLLHAPRWVVADDALSALRDSHRRHVLSICDRELAEMTLIRLGRDPIGDDFWSRTLHMIERSEGPRLRAELPPGAKAVAESPSGAGRRSPAGHLEQVHAANAERSGTTGKHR